MSLAQAFPTMERPSSRWLLLGSLALNLFFVGIAIAMLVRSPAPSYWDRNVFVRVERLAATLPPADADILRGEIQANRAAIEIAEFVDDIVFVVRSGGPKRDNDPGGDRRVAHQRPQGARHRSYRQLRPHSPMTITAHDAAYMPRRGAGAAARGTGQLAHAVTGGLFLVVVFLLFAVSSGVLGRLGINHGGITGAIASKIHPATYLAFFTLAFLTIARRNPASFFASAGHAPTGNARVPDRES